MLRRLKEQHPNAATTMLDLSLDVTGPAVERLDSHLGPVKAWGGSRVPLILEAGATYRVPIGLLATKSHVEDGDAKGFWSHQAFWVQPGDYLLSARLTAFVSPAPKGAPAVGEGLGSVTLVSNAVKLRVVEAKR
jgi:hypothetical protein